jgi:hypothetical protein
MIFEYLQIYVNFHRATLLTESDKRKYKEIFSKLTGSNETLLPVLSSVQSKSSKVIKGPTNQYPINIPTNLTALVEKEVSSCCEPSATINQANDQTAHLPTNNASIHPCVRNCLSYHTRETSPTPLAKSPTSSNVTTGSISPTKLFKFNDPINFV